MTPVHTAYRLRLVALLASACALVAACDGGRVAPSLLTVTPARACGGTATTLALAGSGFEARVDGVLGTATAVEPAVTATAGGGAPVPLASRWLSTAALSVAVPAGMLAAGTYDIAVANPDGARATLAQAFTSDPAPRVDNVTPPQLCSTGGDFTVTGSGFVAGASVTLSDGTTTLPGTNVAVASATQLSVHFGTNSYANNAQLDLTVANPDGCSGTLASALHRRSGTGGCP